MPIRPPAIDSREQGSFSALADGQVDRPGGARGERDSDDFAALAGDQQGPVPALKTEVLDVGSGRLGPRGPLSASREISACSACRPEPGGAQEAAEFVAVQRDGVRCSRPGCPDFIGTV